MTRRPSLSPSLACAALLSLAVLAATGPAAFAEPIESPGGTVILPLSGLSVELPLAEPGCSYRLSGSWSIDANGAYDGRDVVDEACADSLVAGAWISLGYFTAGDPAAVVASVAMTDDWTTEADLWGAHWAVHGGTYDLGDLGPTPTLVMCTPMGGGMSILMHRYFLHGQLPAQQEVLLEAAEKAAVLRSAWLACSNRSSQPAFPARRDEIRNRGELSASRNVHLPRMNMDLTIPEDGFVWVVRQDTTQAADFLDRMAPSLPDVSLEVAYIPDVDGPTAFASIAMDKLDVAPENLPDAWDAGPMLVGDGLRELTASFETLEGVVIVGVIQDRENTDVGFLQPLLQAIADAAVAAEVLLEDE